eukprot:1686876-Ditylum_brightwellii.AAC.1
MDPISQNCRNLVPQSSIVQVSSASLTKPLAECMPLPPTSTSQRIGSTTSHSSTLPDSGRSVLKPMHDSVQKDTSLPMSSILQSVSSSAPRALEAQEAAQPCTPG